MNKILLDSAIDINKKEKQILNLNEDKTININNESTIYLFIDNNIKINFNLKAKSNIYILTTKNLKVDFNLQDNVNLSLYHIVITNTKITNEINIYHNAKKTTSNIVSHGISYLNGNLKLIMNGTINKNMKTTKLDEKSRIINIGKAKSTIEPNLYINEYDSLANHSAYTGPFSEKDIFYLQTKGLSKTNSLAILLRGFLKINITEKEYLKKIDFYIDEIIKEI